MVFGLNVSRGPVGELTSEANARQMTTLTNKAAWLMAIYESQVSMWNPDMRRLLAEAIADPEKGKLFFARYSEQNRYGEPNWRTAPEQFARLFVEFAKAVKGEFRKDAVDAMRASTPQEVGLTVAGAQPSQVPAEPRGV